MSKKKWKKRAAKKSEDTAADAGKPSPEKTLTAKDAPPAAQPSSIQHRVTQLEGQVGRIAQVLSLLDKKISPIVEAFTEASNKAKQRSASSEGQAEKLEPSEGRPLYDPKQDPKPAPPRNPYPQAPASGGGVDLGGLDIGTVADILKGIFSGGESSSESPFEAEMLKGFREMYVKSFTDFVSRQDTLRQIGEEVLKQIAKGKVKFELETRKED